MARSETPYSRFAADELTLRDMLAIERTVEANERTLLGYIRTTLALFVTGASMLKFLDTTSYHVVGGVLMGMGAVLFVVGLTHFVQRRRALAPCMPSTRDGTTRKRAQEPSD